MKNSKLRRILLTLACAVLLVSLSVGATLAYLTNTTGVVTNTFTVGNVTISLDEAFVNEYGERTSGRGAANTYKLIPGHTYVKDPIVYIDEDSEECFVFVKVVNGISDLTIETSTDEAKTIADQMTAKGWVPVDDVANVWCYYGGKDQPTKVAGGAELPVFDNFTLKTDAAVDTGVTEWNEDETEVTNGKAITIKAYAIQADGFDTPVATDLWEKGGFN